MKRLFSTVISLGIAIIFVQPQTALESSAESSSLAPDEVFSISERVKGRIIGA